MIPMIQMKTISNILHRRLWSFWLLAVAAACPLSAQEVVGAESGVVMEATDIYKDTHQVPLSGGMTLYLPQSGWENSMVLCDAQGNPVWQMPLHSMSRLRFLNAPAATVELSDLSAINNPNLMNAKPFFKWNLAGKDYNLMDEGEWRFSDDLSTLTLVTASNGRYAIPLKDVELIFHRDYENSIVICMYKLYGDAEIYNWAFWNGQVSSQDQMHLNFYATLPIEGIKYSVLVPSNEAMTHWTDVVSLTSVKPRVLNMEYVKGNIPVKTLLYRYDAETGTMGNRLNLENLSNEDILNRLRILLRSHLIIHRNGEDGLLSGNEYFVAEDGAIVRVVAEQGQLAAVQGTFQLWNQSKGLTQFQELEEADVRLDQCRVTKRLSDGNGTFYLIDNPLDATPQSVYGALSADPSFASFLELCMPNDELLKASGLVDNKQSSENRRRALSMYQTFAQKGGVDYNLNFLSDTPFTLYVPTNEAIAREIAAGKLGTWEDVEDYYSQLPTYQSKATYLLGGDIYYVINDNSNKDTIWVQESQLEEPCVLHSDSLLLQSKITSIVNFVRAHIHFGIEIADKQAFSARSHSTMLVKPVSLTTPQLYVQSTGNGNLIVTDECGNKRTVLNDHKNIFVRDIHCVRNGKDTSPTNMMTMNNISIQDYSTGVIHQIDGVLKYYPE